MFEEEKLGVAISVFECERASRAIDNQEGDHRQKDDDYPGYLISTQFFNI